MQPLIFQQTKPIYNLTSPKRKREAPNQNQTPYKDRSFKDTQAKLKSSFHKLPSPPDQEVQENVWIKRR